MPDREDALQATAEDLIADAVELQALERRKAALASDDPRQEALAVEAQELVRDMAPKAAAQREIVNDSEAFGGEPA